MSQLLEFQVGDRVWVYGNGHQGDMTEVEVVHICNIKGYSYPQYIVAFPTAMADVLEVRDGYAMSDDSDRPIGLWRK